MKERRDSVVIQPPDSDLSIRYCSPASGINIGYGSLSSMAKGLRHRVLFKRNSTQTQSDVWKTGSVDMIDS